jgi:hypothetical protein
LILQSDWSRLFLILIPTPITSIILFILAILVLKRKINRISISLASFYLILCSGLVLNVIFLLLVEFSLLEPLYVFIMYYTLSFLITYAFTFLPVFILNILKIETIFTLKKMIYMLLFYAITILSLFLLFPEGVELIEENNWRPIFSIPFSITLCIYFAITVMLPTLFYSSRLFKSFKDKNLRKRLRSLIIGIVICLFIYIGMLVYNTWPDPIYRLIWSTVSIFLTIGSSGLVYYGIGPSL